MTNSYRDTASTAGALGTVETGGQAWQIIRGGAGSWTKASGMFVGPTTGDLHPFFATDFGYSDVEISILAAASQSSDAIYFRVKDSANWMRATVWAPTYMSGGDALYISTADHKLILDQCINGVVTTVKQVNNAFSYTSSAMDFKVVARRNSIKLYLNGIEKLSHTSSTHQSETKHGAGYRHDSTGQLPPDGTYYSFDFSGRSHLDDFRIRTLQPDVPAIEYPTSFGTVNSATPGLQGNVPASYGYPQKVEWQLASNSAFTAGVRTIMEPNSSLRNLGRVTTTVPVANALTQSTWYVRARTVNEFGDVSSWTSAVQFSVSHPPTSINHFPTGGRGVATAVPFTFSWQFSDTSITDSQTAYQIIVERNSDGVQVMDTGKVLSASQFADLTIAATYNDVELRWRIRLWDAEDVVGPYSSYNVIKPSTKPVIALVAPTDGAVVISSSPLIDWNFTATAGRTLKSFRIVIVNTETSETVYDTQTILSTESQHQVVGNVLRNGNSYQLTLTVADSTDISQTQTISFDVSYITPDAPTVGIEYSQYEDSGYIRLTWIGATVDGNFVSWRVYRKFAGSSDWEKIYETAESGRREYLDYLAPAQSVLDYKVTQIINSFGELVESESNVVSQISTSPGGYWLIDPIVPTQSIRLYNVTDDTYQHTTERSEVVVIGRGRHVDVGQKSGISGTLIAKLRTSSDGTAREKKQRLENAADMGIAFSLRNPFGDIYTVSIGDLQLSRINGVGPEEFVDVTIPYLEVD